MPNVFLLTAHCSLLTRHFPHPQATLREPDKLCSNLDAAVYKQAALGLISCFWWEAPEEDGLAQSCKGAKEEEKECRESKLCVFAPLLKTPSSKPPSAQIPKTPEDAVSKSKLCASAPLREKLLPPELQLESADSSLPTHLEHLASNAVTAFE